MKSTAYLSLLLFVCLIAVGCKDGSSVNSLATTSLASAVQAGPKVTVTLDGKVIRSEVLTPQRWDGQSPVESGAMYVFNSKDEARAAYAGNQVMLKQLEELGEAKESKIKSSTRLALGDWDATIEQDYLPEECGYINVYSRTENPSDVSGTKTHGMWVQRTFIGEIYSYSENYTGIGNLVVEVEEMFECDGFQYCQMAHCWVTQNSTTQMSDTSDQSCN